MQNYRPIDIISVTVSKDFERFISEKEPYSHLSVLVDTSKGSGSRLIPLEDLTPEAFEKDVLPSDYPATLEEMIGDDRLAGPAFNFYVLPDYSGTQNLDFNYFENHRRVSSEDDRALAIIAETFGMQEAEKASLDAINDQIVSMFTMGPSSFPHVMFSLALKPDEHLMDELVGYGGMGLEKVKLFREEVDKLGFDYGRTMCLRNICPKGDVPDSWVDAYRQKGLESSLEIAKLLGRDMILYLDVDIANKLDISSFPNSREGIVLKTSKDMEGITYSMVVGYKTSKR